MVPAAAILLLASLASLPFPLSDDVKSPAAAREFHIRPLDPRVREWMAMGVSGSPTFLALMDRLAVSDLVVYVQAVDRIRGGIGGQLSFVTSTKTVRYLRIELAASGSPAELVALLGHELQHAVEIADAPRVRSSRDMAMLYLQIGGVQRTGTRYESVAARIAGDRVRDELAGHRRTG